MACQLCTKRNLVYRVYYSAFYTKRSLKAIYREYYLANLRYKLPTRPKKPHKSHTGRGKGKGLNKTAPPSTGSKMGRKKGKRGKRGSSRGKSSGSTKLVST